MEFHCGAETIVADHPKESDARGVNPTGQGPDSNEGLGFTAAAVPGKPVVLSVSASTVTISWNANGNPPGTDYRAEIFESKRQLEALIGRTL